MAAEQKNPEDMSVEALEGAIRLYKAGIKLSTKFLEKGDSLVEDRRKYADEKMVSLMLEYYRRLKDEEIIKRTIAMALHIAAKEGVDVKGKMLGFFRALILEEGEKWMADCMEYLLAAGYGEHVLLSNLVNFKKQIKDSVSEEWLDKLEEILEQRARLRLQKMG